MTPKNKILFLHVFCFFLVFFSITCLSFWQLFIDKNGNKISLKQFLKPTVLAQAISQVRREKLDFAAILARKDSYQREINNGQEKIYHRCEPDCQFLTVDLKSGNISKSTPAINNSDPQGKLFDIKNVVFDETRGLAGYQHSNQYFTLEYKSGGGEFIPTLLNSIELNLPSGQLEFAGYDEQTGLIIFQKDSNSYIFVKANQPSVYFYEK